MIILTLISDDSEYTTIAVVDPLTISKYSKTNGTIVSAINIDDIAIVK